MPVVLTVIGIMLLVYCLLLCPVIVIADLGNSSELILKYLCFKFKLYPRKQKKRKEDKTTQNKKSETAKKPKAKKQSMSQSVGKYGDLVNTFLSMFGKIFNHLSVRKLRLSIVVGDEDAAKVAVEYGAVCAAAYPILGLLDSKFDIKESEIDIRPDFDAKSSEGEFYADFRVKAFRVLSVVFGLISSLVKYRNN